MGPRTREKAHRGGATRRSVAGRRDIVARRPRRGIIAVEDVMRRRRRERLDGDVLVFGRRGVRKPSSSASAPRNNREILRRLPLVRFRARFVQLLARRKGWRARGSRDERAQMPRRTIAKTTRTTKSTPPRRRTRRMTTTRAPPPPTRAPPPPTRAPHPPTRVPPPPPTRTLPTSRFSVSAPRPPRARLRAFVPPRTPSPSPRARSPSACRASADTATACSAPSPAGSTLGSEREVPSDPQPPPRGSSRAHSPAVARATSRGPTFARFSSEDSATSSATPRGGGGVRFDDDGKDD